jgi:hypothetical protein
MSNILQVNSTPSPERIDPTGVNAPGQVNTGQQVAPVGNTGSGAQSGQIGAEPDGSLAVDFQSNYAAFVRELLQSETLNEDLTALLFGDGAAQLQSADPEIQNELATLYQSVSAETPEELLELLTTQSQGQTRYGGELFDAVRSYLGSQPGQIGQDTAARFLHAYQSMSEGEHLLEQMNTLSDDLRSLMLVSYRGQFSDLMGKLDLAAPNGETQANTRVLNDEIIPFLASYVGRVHDYGAVRKAAVLFSLYAFHYENGDRSEVEKAYAQLLKSNDFQMLLQEDPGKLLNESLRRAEEPNDQVSHLADSFSSLLLRGSQGTFGTAEQERCSAAMQSMLANESVYLPIRHMVLPFRYQGKNVMSEMWIDPDSGQDKDETLSRMFIKYNIQDLGNFDLVATWQRKTVKVQLFVPDAVTDLRDPKRIAADVRQILQDNGMNAEVSMFRRMRELSVMEVFPDLKDKERTINLQV